MDIATSITAEDLAVKQKTAQHKLLAKVCAKHNLTITALACTSQADLILMIKGIIGDKFIDVQSLKSGVADYIETAQKPK